MTDLQQIYTQSIQTALAGTGLDIEDLLAVAVCTAEKLLQERHDQLALECQALSRERLGVHDQVIDAVDRHAGARFEHDIHSALEPVLGQVVVTVRPYIQGNKYVLVTTIKRGDGPIHEFRGPLLELPPESAELDRQAEELRLRRLEVYARQQAVAAIKDNPGKIKRILRAEMATSRLRETDPARAILDVFLGGVRAVVERM